MHENINKRVLMSTEVITHDLDESSPLVCHVILIPKCCKPPIFNPHLNFANSGFNHVKYPIYRPPLPIQNLCNNTNKIF